MASDKPNGTVYTEHPEQVEQVDVADFLNHLHWDVVALAKEHTAIFWAVAVLVLERIVFYISIIMMRLTS